MKDYLVKAIAQNKQVRAHAEITTKTIEEARRRHDMLPVVSMVLGRSMTAGVILGSMQKGEKTTHKNEWPRINWDHPGWCKRQGGSEGLCFISYAHAGLFCQAPIVSGENSEDVLHLEQVLPVAVGVLVNPVYDLTAVGFIVQPM